MNAYGPQETDTNMVKINFYTKLEEEIKKS